MKNYLNIGHLLIVVLLIGFIGYSLVVLNQKGMEVPTAETLSSQELFADAASLENGWQNESGQWYYYQGGKKLKDQWIDSIYYVGSDGAMLVDTITPDGYQVGSDGAWIQE